MKNKKSFYISFALLLLCPRLLFAGGAYLVDDGAIDDKGLIQFENWFSRSSTGEDVYVINPGYQIFDNAEFSMQATFTDQSETSNTLWPQLKYQLFNNQKDVQSSIAVGVNYSSNGHKIYGGYAYSATTLKINEIFNIHINLGWQNWENFLNNKTVNFFTYGLGSETHLTEKLSLTAEFFTLNGLRRTGQKDPGIQAGFRYLVGKTTILDLIYGHNINGNEQGWVTIGLSFCF
jgi:hypothetical protein